MDSTSELEMRLAVHKLDLMQGTRYEWAEGSARTICKRTDYPEIVELRRTLEKAVETADWWGAADAMSKYLGAGLVFQMWLTRTYEHNDDRQRKGLQTVFENVLHRMAVKRLFLELLDEGRDWLAQRLMEKEDISNALRDCWLTERNQKQRIAEAAKHTMNSFTGEKIFILPGTRLPILKCVDGRPGGSTIPHKNLNKT